MTGGGEPAAFSFELGADGPVTIVVRIDDSAPSWRAFHYAAGLARRECARLVAVHARPASRFVYANPELPVVVFDDDDQIEAVTRRALALAEEHCILLEVVEAQGDPSVALTAVATDWHADLIVVGGTGKPTLRLFGTTAIRIMRALSAFK